MLGARDVLRKEGWRRLVFKVDALTRRAPKGDVRSFLEVVLWIFLTGAPRLDLAERFARWDGIYRRYRRWALAPCIVDDRAFDSDAFVAHVRALGMRTMTSSRRTRRYPRRLGGACFARRNVIERSFARVKAFRGVATRYEKTSCSYAGFAAAVSMLVASSGWTG